MSSRVRPVVISQRIVPHYRLPVLRRLSSRFDEFSVVYGQSRGDEALDSVCEREEAWLKRSENVYYGAEGRVYRTRLRGLVPRGAVVFVNAEVGNLNVYRMIALRRFFDYRLVLWTFGYDPVLGFDPTERVADRIRGAMYRAADAVVFYWDRGRARVEEKIALGGKAYVAPNTLDTSAQEALRGDFERKTRETLIGEAGLEEGLHFCFVGRLIPDKEVDLLLRCWKGVEEQVGNARLLVVGDGPERPRLEEIARSEGLQRVRFMGEISDPQEVGRLLYLSEAMLMPGRLGLSVVHAFCFGTPVLSQDKGELFHGEGIGYMEPGRNGILARDGDRDEITQSIVTLARDPSLRAALSEGALRTLRERASIERMVDGLEAAAHHAAAR